MWHQKDKVIMTTTTRLLGGITLFGLLGVAFGCQPQPAKPVEPPKPTSKVVATYQGKTVTLAEVDKQIKRELDEIKWERYRLREAQINQIIIRDLVEAEAKKQGVPARQIIQKYAEEHTKPPTLEEVEAFFEKNVKSKNPNAKFVEFRDRIIGHLGAEADKKTLTQFFDHIKKQANAVITLAKPEIIRINVDSSGVSKGPASAPVTIVEFADFQCGYCAQVSPTMDALVKAFPGKVKVVFKHFPLPFHTDAPKASEASMCANDQGKFWEYHDLVFSNQAQIGIDTLKQYTGQLQLKLDEFNTCLDSGKHGPTIAKDYQAGVAAGVQETPSVYVNGLLQNSLELAALKATVEAELAEPKAN